MKLVHRNICKSAIAFPGPLLLPELTLKRIADLKNVALPTVDLQVNNTVISQHVIEHVREGKKSVFIPYSWVLCITFRSN